MNLVFLRNRRLCNKEIEMIGSCSGNDQCLIMQFEEENAKLKDQNVLLEDQEAITTKNNSRKQNLKQLYEELEEITGNKKQLEKEFTQRKRKNGNTTEAEEHEKDMINLKPEVNTLKREKELLLREVAIEKSMNEQKEKDWKNKTKKCSG